MARLNLTRPLAIGLGLVSLAFAACSKSSSPVPAMTPTPSPVPTITGVPIALNSPCAATFGIAYEPDGGNGAGFTGVQTTHFEDSNQNLCAATAAPSAVAPGVAFAASVGPFAISNSRGAAMAILSNGAGGYTLAQDVFGSASGSIVPAGAPYDLAAFPPTPAPTTSASPSATATPSNAPLFSDVPGLAVLSSSVSGTLAFAIGTPATSSPYAIVALTSLNNAPPQYGGAVPFTSASNFTLKSIPANPRSIVRIGALSPVDGVDYVALARGPQDLLAFSVTATGSGYTFDAKSIDATLGSNVPLRGNGALAFDPADGSRALVGGTTAGGTTTLTLVTGLPAAIVKSSTVALPGNIRSIAIANTGAIGVVGTDAGIVVVKGLSTGTLSIVAPFAPLAGSNAASAPTYRTCAASSAVLSTIDSVAFSGDQKFLVALGSTPGVTCPSGYNDSIVAVPLSTTTGTTPSPAPTTSASPAPTSFVQNNVIAPPAGADYFSAY